MYQTHDGIRIDLLNGEQVLAVVLALGLVWAITWALRRGRENDHV